MKSEVPRPHWEAEKRRLKTKLFVVFFFIAFVVFACTEKKSSRDGIVIEDSKKYEASIYRQNCAICHGKEAYGKMVDGKPVPSLRFGDVKKKSEEEIYQQIVSGKLPMPSFKDRLTEKEIRKMVDFIIYDLQVREREGNKAKGESRNLE